MHDSAHATAMVERRIVGVNFAIRFLMLSREVGDIQFDPLRITFYLFAAAGAGTFKGGGTPLASR